MAEKALWQKIRPLFKPYMDLLRIENVVGSGTPDVNYCMPPSDSHPHTVEGWIELKQIPSFPVRADTIVELDHYTPVQRNWHLRRRALGAQVFVLLEVVNSDFLYLFDAATAARGLGLTWDSHDVETRALVSGWSGPADLPVKRFARRLQLSLGKPNS